MGFVFPIPSTTPTLRSRFRERFQEAPPDHVRVWSSSCYFHRKLVRFDQRHVTHLQSGNAFKLGGYTTWIIPFLIKIVIEIVLFLFLGSVSVWSILGLLRGQHIWEFMNDKRLGVTTITLEKKNSFKTWLVLCKILLKFSQQCVSMK